MGDRRALRALNGVIAVLGGLGVAGVYWFSVLTDRGQRVENRALESSTFEGQWRGLLDLVSIPAIGVALAVAVVCALLFRDPRGAVRAILVVGGANLLGQALKHGFLVRPDLAEYDANNTFPSGHAVAFASVLFVFVMIAPGRIRLVVSVIATVILGVVCAQLLGYGWHRLSDVLGAILLVLAVVGLSGVIVPASRGARRWRLPRLAAVITVLCLVALAAATLVLIAVAALRRDESEAALLLLATQAAAVFAVLLGTWLAAVSAPRRGIRSLGN